MVVGSTTFFNSVVTGLISLEFVSVWNGYLVTCQFQWLGPLTAAFESEAHWISDAVARYMEYHVLGKAFEGVIEKVRFLVWPT